MWKDKLNDQMTINVPVIDYLIPYHKCNCLAWGLNETIGITNI